MFLRGRASFTEATSLDHPHPHDLGIRLLTRPLLPPPPPATGPTPSPRRPEAAGLRTLQGMLAGRPWRAGQGRIHVPCLCRHWNAVAWAQFLRANSRPEYILPCAGNRGVAERALQEEQLPPRPASGCPQPHVVGCPGWWLYPTGQ